VPNLHYSRFSWQFSLKLVLLATIPIAACFAFVAHKKRQFDREWEAAEYLMSEVQADVGINGFGMSPSLPAMQWDRIVYGEYFSTVSYVHFSKQPVPQEAWDAVCSLSELRSLRLFGCDEIEIEPETLSTINHLQSLTIISSEIPEGALEDLDKVPGLQHVELRRIGPANKDLADHVSRVGELTSLDLCEMPISASAMRRFCESDHLEVLNLTDCQIDFSEVVPLENVVQVSITRAKVSSEALQAICRSPKVKHLSLRGCDVDLDGFQGFGEMRQLLTLELNGIPLTNSHLQDITKLKNLSRLELGESDITDATLVSLSSLEHLRKLDLHNTEVSDMGVQFLTELPQLRELVLRRTRISNQSLYLVSRMKSLEKLDVRSTAITDDGFLALHGTTLQDFEIAGTNTTEQALRNLGQAPELLVNISCTEMPEMKEWLKKIGGGGGFGTLYPPYQVRIWEGWYRHPLFRDEPIPYCYSGDCSCQGKDDKASE